MTDRKIKFQYFVAYIQKQEDDRWVAKEKFDIMQWIDIVDRDSICMKTIDLGNLKARLEKMKSFGDIWAFRFLKLREDNIPSIAKEDHEAEGISLNDDEYIGEDLYMLYDSDKRIAMIQVNRFALALNRLEEFMSAVWGVDGERIRFIAIMDKMDNKWGKRKYRSIEVSFANIDRNMDTTGRSLGAIMNMYRKVKGYSGSIKISLGQTRNATLDTEIMRELITDSLEDDAVSGVKMRVQDDDERYVEEIDLFNNICTDVISYKMEARQPLGSNYVVDRMLVAYTVRKENLLKLL